MVMGDIYESWQWNSQLVLNLTVYQTPWASSWYTMTFNFSAVFDHIINRTSEGARWLWWRLVMSLQFVTTRHTMDLILFFWGFNCPNLQSFWILFGRCLVRITARNQNQFTLVLFNVPRDLQGNPKFAHSSRPLTLLSVSWRFFFSWRYNPHWGLYFTAL